jgi:hypothetical protein
MDILFKATFFVENFPKLIAEYLVIYKPWQRLAQ